MKTTSKETGKKAKSHALFWTLLKETPGYNERYKEVIKEGIVMQHTGNATASLSEMWKKFPAEYSEMIEEMKGDFNKKKERYDEDRNIAAKRVIAVICTFLDKSYTFTSSGAKIAYAKSVACRASNCSDFNKIPLSRLSAIYGEYCNKNKVDAKHPAADYVIGKN